MRDEDIHEVMARLHAARPAWQTPSVYEIGARTGDPFRVLISTILSARTKDATTTAATERLFALAGNPADMAALSVEQVSKAIYPVTFHEVKAPNILRVCRLLLEKYGGRVPTDIDELVTLPGVGRKSANLVVNVAFDKPGISVDVHVHRVTNRWGYVLTKNPDATEMALRAKLPEQYWVKFNDTLVAFGQNVCYPVAPACSRCPVFQFCERVGVTRSR